MKQKHWHTLDIKETSSALKTNPSTGLSPEEAQKRLEKYGPNEIQEKKKASPILILLQQFNDVLIWILLAAALVSGLVLGELIDAFVIGIILILIAVLGFIQHFKAEKAMEALKALAAPTATAIRQTEQEIKAGNLVIGDIILLEAGDKVPADARLIEAASLQVEEASLTGESAPVNKSVKTLKEENLALSEQKNMLFLGTTVARGRGRAIIVATARNTEMGKIATLIEVEEELTPLQKELKKVGFKIAVAIIIIAISVFLIGIAKGNGTAEMFLTSVALAVAAIPEGLPAIVTITLAIGVQYMAKQKAIVRRLHAVETLGSTDYIISDKTGTLTLNEMTVVRLYLNSQQFELKKGKLRGHQDKNKPSDLKILMYSALLSNDSRKKDKEYTGEPTELALVNAGSQLGFDKNDLDDKYKRIDELPFESERKEMTTVNKFDDKIMAFTKGAVEILLSQSDTFLENGKIKSLSAKDKKRLIDMADNEAGKGHRMLGFAYREFDKIPKKNELEKKLVFIGMMGLLDPPRPEAGDAIKLAKRAGIKISMVTGDALLTAKKIASQIGLDGKEKSLTGKDLKKLKDGELASYVEKVSVYARVDPAHKMKIVTALKEKGYIVAVTGDGVNDAPALKKADIGIAMGITGTDVSKEASDIILADDNFATIIKAIKQGRIIFANLRKFISFLLSANISEVFTIFFGILLAPVGVTILLPIQILWINLVTDAFPALALGVDPPEPGIMKKQPRLKEESILSPKQGARIAIEGVILSAAALFIFGITLFYFNNPEIKLQTMVFTVLVLIQLIHAFNYRTTNTIFSIQTFKNRYLLYAFFGSLALQIAVIYIPFLQPFFKTTPLSISDWGLILATSFVAEILIDRAKVTFFSK